MNSSIIETRTGTDVVRDRSLRSSVAKSKRDKTSKTDSQDFYKEWKKSLSEPINELSAMFAR